MRDVPIFEFNGLALHHVTKRKLRVQENTPGDLYECGRKMEFLNK